MKTTEKVRAYARRLIAEGNFAHRPDSQLEWLVDLLDDIDELQTEMAARAKRTELIHNALEIETGKRRFSNDDPEAEEVWSEFWAAIVAPTGDIDPEQVKKELRDYWVFMDQCRDVYSHVTGNQVSKVNTLSREVISVADDYFEECVEDAIFDSELGHENRRLATLFNQARNRIYALKLLLNTARVIMDKPSRDQAAVVIQVEDEWLAANPEETVKYDDGKK